MKFFFIFLSMYLLSCIEILGRNFETKINFILNASKEILARHFYYLTYVTFFWGEKLPFLHFKREKFILLLDFVFFFSKSKLYLFA